MNEDKMLKITRRQTIGLMGAAALAVIVGCNGDDDQSSGATATEDPTDDARATGNASSTAAAATETTAATETATAVPVSCVVTPALTEGPYFVDERLNSSDIREDRQGIPLTLTFYVSNMLSEGCAPITGAAFDIWHCDADGAYSDIANGAGQPNTSGETYCRGLQYTDDNGKVQFTTIYPGWYSGRAIHIHFKVRQDPDSSSGLEFTSQIFFDDALTAQIHSEVEPYASNGQPDVTNERDNIYAAANVIELTGDSTNGYSGTFHVGVA